MLYPLKMHFDSLSGLQGLRGNKTRLPSAYSPQESSEAYSSAAPKGMHSVHPLLQEVALLQLAIDLLQRHGRVLREVRRVLPLEELHVVHRDRLATEVAVRGRDLVLRLAELERLG